MAQWFLMEKMCCTMCAQKSWGYVISLGINCVHICVCVCVCHLSTLLGTLNARSIGTLNSLNPLVSVSIYYIRETAKTD